MRWGTFLSAVMLVAALLAAPARAESRLALVIAQSDYEDIPALAVPTQDGETVSKALAKAGFKDGVDGGPVRSRANLKDAELHRTVAAFREAVAKAGPDSFAIIYFAGHGVALGRFGDVAVLPLDFDPDQPGRNLLTRAGITEGLLAAGAGNVVVVLDVCRNVVRIADTEEAAAPTLSEAEGRGTGARSTPARPRKDQGFLIAYSTSPDQVAYDTGVFSKVFAEEIVRPRQDIAEAFKRVSDRVSSRSGAARHQKPTFDYGLQGAPPCFISCDPSAEPGRFYDCASCPWMRMVPAGSFPYGSPAGEPGRVRDEPLQRETRLNAPFTIGVFEVTVAEWKACVLDGGCAPLPTWAKENPNPNIPATHISRADAEAYLRWLSAQSGRRYRLPTEMEWEFAARSGATTPFSFGSAIEPSAANYDHTARYQGSAAAPYRGYPEVVNAYAPNDFGLYQMHGNVWELTEGCAEPAGARGCRKAVVRGGSFQSAPDELRASNRFVVDGGKRRIDVGVRVVRDLEPDESTT